MRSVDEHMDQAPHRGLSAGALDYAGHWRHRLIAKAGSRPWVYYAPVPSVVPLSRRSSYFAARMFASSHQTTPLLTLSLRAALPHRPHYRLHSNS